MCIDPEMDGTLTANELETILQTICGISATFLHFIEECLTGVQIRQQMQARYENRQIKAQYGIEAMRCCYKYHKPNTNSQLHHYAAGADQNIESSIGWPEDVYLSPPP